MQPYGNPHSGVAAFTLHAAAIDVEFRDGKRYRYDAANPGPEAVRIMQQLALAGHGLATYINQHVRDRFARRLPSRRRPLDSLATPKPTR